MIIGVTGIAQAGKDTVATHLINNYGFNRKGFADKLKQFCYLINPELRESVDAVGWEATKKIPVFRRFLQDVGHNAREVFGQDFWVNQVLPPYVNVDGNWVFPDMRYGNEFKRVEDLGGYLVRVTRPGLKMVNKHVTETQHLNFRVDYTIINTTIESVHKQIDEIMGDINV